MCAFGQCSKTGSAVRKRLKFLTMKEFSGVLSRKCQCRFKKGFVSHDVIEGEETLKPQHYPREFAEVILEALVVIKRSQS